MVLVYSMHPDDPTLPYASGRFKQVIIQMMFLKQMLHVVSC